LKYLYIRLKNI